VSLCWLYGKRSHRASATKAKDKCKGRKDLLLVRGVKQATAQSASAAESISEKQKDQDEPMQIDSRTVPVQVNEPLARETTPATAPSAPAPALTSLHPLAAPAPHKLTKRDRHLAHQAEVARNAQRLSDLIRDKHLANTVEPQQLRTLMGVSAALTGRLGARELCDATHSGQSVLLFAHLVELDLSCDVVCSGRLRCCAIASRPSLSTGSRKERGRPLTRSDLISLAVEGG
jgi:hypothetical protein